MAPRAGFPTNGVEEGVGETGGGAQESFTRSRPPPAVEGRGWRVARQEVELRRALLEARFLTGRGPAPVRGPGAGDRCSPGPRYSRAPCTVESKAGNRADDRRVVVASEDPRGPQSGGGRGAQLGPCSDGPLLSPTTRISILLILSSLPPRWLE